MNTSPSATVNLPPAVAPAAPPPVAVKEPAIFKLAADPANLYRKHETEYFTVVSPVPVLTMDGLTPGVSWKGGKMPYLLWVKAITFLLWTHTAKKNEGHIQLFYNPETKEWDCWAFPQKGSYAHVSVLDSTPEYIEQRRRFPAPWLPLGTIHHHSGMAAFASGTDKQDEAFCEGLHVTVGKMSDATLDRHIRSVVRGVELPTDIAQWVDAPEGYVLPAELRKRFFEIALFTKEAFKIYAGETANPDNLDPLWKTNCTDEKVHYEQNYAHQYLGFDRCGGWVNPVHDERALAGKGGAAGAAAGFQGQRKEDLEAQEDPLSRYSWFDGYGD